MHIFNQKEDEKLIEFGILPVQCTEEFYKFHDREALGLRAIICPLKEYTQEEIDTFYSALRTLGAKFSRAKQGKGNLRQLNLSEEKLANETNLPEKLLKLAHSMQQAFERAVTPNIIRYSKYPETSFRINATYPNEPHIHKGEHTPYGMAAYIDGDTTIMFENNAPDAKRISLPKKSLVLFLASKTWHQAADIKAEENSPDQRLHIQMVSGQRHATEYDRYTPKENSADRCQYRPAPLMGS